MNNNWNTDTFFKENNIDLENITYQELSNKIGLLSEEQKKIVLGDYRVKKDYQKFLLSVPSRYNLYDGIFEYLDFTELQEIICDKSFLIEYFHKNPNTGYILFASAIKYTQDLNKLLDLFLDNEELFHYFKENYTKIYSILNDIDNNHLKKLIDKIISTNSFKHFPYISISKENEEFIYNQEYPIEIFMELILNHLSISKQREFFLNDPRAELTIPYLNHSKIEHYITNEVIFGNRILKNPKFFELLKSEEIVEFRYTINNLLNHCTDPHYILEKVKKYYDKLIDSYQEESGLFKEYEYILEKLGSFKHHEYVYSENPDLSFEELRKNMDPFIFNREIYININQEYLQKETGHKLSELVIDYLFQDNIYNVWVNIQELLRYHNHLNDYEKILTKDRIEFYNMFLNIDNYSNEIKIQLYNIFKELDINRMFYEDLRKTKDLAYKKIQDKLITPKEHNEYIDEEQSKKYETQIYDLRNEEFYMLVRVMFNKYHDIASKMGSSYSIISSNNTEVFHDGGENLIIYGYNSFNIDSVKHMYEIDSYTTEYLSNKYENTPYANRIATIEELADSPGYSEILLQNKKQEDNGFIAIKPDFLVAIDEISEKTLKVSKELNLPIVIIKSQRKYTKKWLPDDITYKYTGSICSENRKNKRK